MNKYLNETKSSLLVDMFCDIKNSEIARSFGIFTNVYGYNFNELPNYINDNFHIPSKFYKELLENNYDYIYIMRIDPDINLNFTDKKQSKICAFYDLKNVDFYLPITNPNKFEKIEIASDDTFKIDSYYYTRSSLSKLIRLLKIKRVIHCQVGDLLSVSQYRYFPRGYYRFTFQTNENFLSCTKSYLEDRQGLRTKIELNGQNHHEIYISKSGSYRYAIEIAKEMKNTRLYLKEINFFKHKSNTTTINQTVMKYLLLKLSLENTHLEELMPTIIEVSN
jgi:hypothetical protein